jgi:translation initiation factor 2 gamma subunit (eIF-2gamma)
MKNHVIKIYKKHADNVLSRIKPWETRNNDRGYESGDTVTMLVIDDFDKAFPGTPDKYTGGVITAGCEKGFVNFGLLSIDTHTVGDFMVDILNSNEKGGKKCDCL